MAAVYIMLGGAIGGFAGIFSLMTGASAGAAFGQYMLLGHLTILVLVTGVWARSSEADLSQ